MYEIMRSLSVAHRSALVFIWSLFIVVLLDCDSMCTQTVHDPYPRGCGQFCTNILVHLIFKCIVSNKRMRLKIPIYGYLLLVGGKLGTGTELKAEAETYIYIYCGAL